MCDINASVSDAKALLPFKVLDAVTSTGPGSPVDLGGTADTFTMQTSFTGGPSSITVRMEGSLDGVNFFSLQGLDTNLGGQTNNISGTTRLRVRYVRGNVLTLTGGTSPTVTIWLAPAEIL